MILQLTTMSITTQPFGLYKDTEASLYTLENDQGMRVKITDYGATITSILVPDKKGNTENIVCGFDSLQGYFQEPYLANSPYFGCTVGRYAARIKDAHFALEGKSYPLAANAGPNHIHGGVLGFDKKMWEVIEVAEKESPSVKMELFSPDMEEGYPGNLKVTVLFSLNHQSELSIQYTAQTDQTTPVSLTNHTYFNLNAFRENILTHTAQIYSGKFLSVDESDVPLGTMESVVGSAADLQLPKVMGEAFSELPKGFEHFYLFSKETNALAKVARFEEPESGRSLEVFTTEPGMLFYTGYYTGNELRREDGTSFGQFRAFCCETSRHPNGMNFPDVPEGCLTSPDVPYTSTTVFKFGW